MRTATAAGQTAEFFAPDVRRESSDTASMPPERKLTAKELLDTEPIATLRFFNVS